MRFVSASEMATKRAAERRTMIAGIPAAEATLAAARMSGAGVQPRTIANRPVGVRAVEHVAVFVDVKRNEVKVERSEVTALFDRNACAVMRLAVDEMIDEAGVRAALRFAWAGDRVNGPARVRTIDLDRVVGTSVDGMLSAELDVQARADWDVARIGLMRAEFRILDGVMRRDESSTAAAACIYPRYKSKIKLSGMGDQALISACGKLAKEYGYAADSGSLRRQA